MNLARPLVSPGLAGFMLPADAGYRTGRQCLSPRDLPKEFDAFRLDL